MGRCAQIICFGARMSEYLGGGVGGRPCPASGQADVRLTVVSVRN